jgi:hypothetical protein
VKNKINLQVKFKDNNIKENNNQINNFQSIFNNSKNKAKYLILKEPFNDGDL